MYSWIVEAILILLVIYFIARRLIPAKGVRSITAEELKQEMKNHNKQFIDVRNPGEFRPDHIRQFENIPLKKLSKNMQPFSKDQEVIVICQTGIRSNEACKKLRRMGFEHVANVKGGMSAWHQAMK